MTIEQLADLVADDLKKLTDEELHKILSAKFIVTRPEMAERVSATKKPEQPKVYISPQKQLALQAMAAEGIDISFINRKKK